MSCWWGGTSISSGRFSVVMLRLSHAQVAALASRFAPEQPGPLVAGHLVQTGHGAAWADRWPAPRALLVEVAGNYSFFGDAAALRPADMPRLAGFIEAPGPFVPLLRAARADLVDWPRVIYWLPEAGSLPPAAELPLAPDARVRPLTPADTPRLAGLSAETAWVCKTWGGPEGLALSGRAWGAFVGER